MPGMQGMQGMQWMPGMPVMHGGGAADALRIGRAAAALKMDKAKQAAARKWEEVKEKVGGVRDTLAGGGGLLPLR